MIKFGQSIFYVPYPGQIVYCGDRNWFSRINIFSKEWLNIFCYPEEDCNIFSYLFKSSLFGEYNTEKIDFVLIERILIVLNIILIIISIVSLIKVLINRRKNTLDKSNYTIENVLIIFYITQIAMYLYANISMPYACTMDFRYIVPTIFLGMLFIVMSIDEKNTKKYKLITGCIALFSVVSMIFELNNMSLLGL